MNFFKKLTLACLITSFAMSSLVIAENKKELLEKQKIEEAKSNTLGKLFGLIASLAAAGVLFNVDALKDSGLNVGLSASATLYGLSFFAEGENSVALTRMALAAPVITTVGSALMSDAFAGKRGLLAHCSVFGLDEMAKNGTAKSPAFASLSVIAAYVAGKPKLDKVIDWIGPRLPVTGHHFRKAQYEE